MHVRAKVGDIMTRNPFCSTPDASVESVARMMMESNCGEVPICENGKVVGVVTDRDITCRVVARGVDPTDTPASAIMSAKPFMIRPDDPLTLAIDTMERERLRRLPVVDGDGFLVGIISQVDIAARVSQKKAGRMLASLQITNAPRF